MALQVNYSKYFPPKVNSRYFTRQRLMERLGGVDDYRYTLLQAPEGYGKSSLLSDWQSKIKNDEKRTVLWFKVDPQDKENECFWDNLIELMDRTWLGMKSAVDESMALLEQSSPTQMIIALANHVVQCSQAEMKYTLIFDDFHNFASSESESLFFLFAEMLPNNVNIIISSEMFLNNQLIEQDAYNKLQVIGVSELSLTKDETRELLAKETGDAVLEQSLDLAYVKSEGWPLALYVLLEQAQAGKDINQCIEDLSGNDNVLSEAVFKKMTRELPQKVMMFLLETSFLESFSTDLCNYLQDGKEAQAIIQHLERIGAFTFPIDSAHSWYRYHYLFADWLRSQALSFHRDQIRTLNQRACSWYRNNNRKFFAAKHAVAASEGEFVAALTKCVFFCSRITESRLLPWLFRLKEEELRQEPYFCLISAWTYVFSGRPNDACYWLGLAAEHIVSGEVNATGMRPGGSTMRQDMRNSGEDSSAERFDLAARIIQAKCDILVGEVERGIETSTQLLSTMDTLMDDTLKMVLYQNLGEAYEMSGFLEKASKNYQKAMTIARVNGFEFLASFSRYQIIKTVYLQGKLGEAEKLCRVALLECPPDFTVYGALYALLGSIGVMQNKLSDLDSVLKRAFGRLFPDRNIDMYLDACIAQGQYLIACKNYSEALLQFAVARQAIAAHKDVPPRGVGPLVYAHQTRLYIKLKDIESAEDMIKEYESIKFPQTTEGAMYEKIIRGQLAIEDNKVSEETLAELETAASLAIERKYLISLVEIYLLMVRQNYHLEKNSDATRYLKKALEISKREQLAKPFLEGGDVIRLLLVELIGSRNLSYETDKFARKLISFFDMFGGEGVEENTAINWVGDNEESTISFVDHWGLTQRENEVLQLIVRGMNRKEIAVDLCASQNTVKTHISHIYEKMGVHSVAELLRKMMEYEAL